MSGKVCKHILTYIQQYTQWAKLRRKSANLVNLTKKISIKMVEFFFEEIVYFTRTQTITYLYLLHYFPNFKNFPSSHQDQLILQISLNNWRGVLQLTAQNYFTHSITFEVLLCKNRVHMHCNCRDDEFLVLLHTSERNVINLILHARA